MQDSKLPKDIEQWDYETVRRYLLKRTAGFKLFIKYLVKKYQLENISEKDIRRSLYAQGNLSKDILTLCNNFSVDFAFIDNAFSQYLFDKDIGIEQELPIFISWGNQILPEGFYIKINKYTTLETLKKTYHEIQNTINDLGKITKKKFEAKQRNKKLKNIPASLSTYLLIEQDIYSQSKDLKSLKNKRDKYAKPIEDAIVFVTEKLYEDLPEKQEEKKIKQTKDTYYSVMDYYSLPSPTSWGELLIRYLL